jgi:hypothetical protein
MATVTFIKYQKQSAGALRGVAQYVSQDEKTLDENGSQLISGQNCTPQLVSQEFQATRDMCHKESPVWFYHYVQSFSPDEVITGEQAHQLAKEFAAKAWPDSEVLIATHLDAEHIHTHFIVNAVCWETGKMLRQGPNTLRSLRQLSDELCLKHGFSVLPQQKKKQSQGMGTREYRSAAKGESWKFRLMNTIDQCMQFAASKEEFISLMESEGYQVRWTASRKNITYTTPQGMKCRDDRLHELKYTKEVMEREFRVRAEIIYRGIEAAEPAAGDEVQHGVSPTDGIAASNGLEYAVDPAGSSGGRCFGTGGPAAGTVPAGGAAPHPGADGDPGAGGIPNAGGSETGWEEERALYLAAQSPDRAVGLDLAGPDPAGDHGWHGGLADDLVRLGRTLEGGQDAVPVRDATTMHQHADRKTLRRERAKKIALGHKPDDHEDEIDLTMKGY